MKIQLVITLTVLHDWYNDSKPYSTSFVCSAFELNALRNNAFVTELFQYVNNEILYDDHYIEYPNYIDMLSKLSNCNTAEGINNFISSAKCGNKLLTFTAQCVENTIYKFSDLVWEKN